MLRRITLENYMSHVLTVIEPADGLTVLCGPNNCGKSAVVSAVQTVCGENDGDFMVRHGEKIARVTIETDDGHTITWQRKGKAPSYVIDGTEIHRIGRGNLPDGLHDLLKLPNVETPNDKRFPVHFGLQKEPIFLLNSESDTAAFFSTSAEAERLLEMQKQHKSNTQTRRGEQRTVDADLKRLDERLTALSPLQELVPAVQAVEAEYAQLQAKQKDAEEFEARVEAIASGHRRVTALTWQVRALEPLSSPPEMQDPQPIERLISAIVRREVDLGLESRRAQALLDLAAPPAQQEILPLQRLITAMARTARQREHWRAQGAAVEPLRDPPAAADLKPLVALGRRMKALKGQVSIAAAQLAALTPLNEPPVLTDLSLLTTAVSRADRAQKQFARCGVDLAAAETNLAAVEQEIADFVREHPECPTCGGRLSAEHLIHGGAHE